MSMIWRILFVCLPMVLFSVVAKSAQPILVETNAPFDMCEYFPSTAQTWFDGGGATTQLIIDGEKGRNRSYIETPNRKVGFPIGSMNLKSENTCEDSNGASGDCIAAPSLIVPQLSVTTEFTGVDGSINGLSDITINPGHYTAINLMGGNAFDYIQVNIEPGVYWVNQFNATGFAEIHFSNIEKTIIHVQNWNDPGNVIYNHEADPNNLLIAAHGVNSNILMAGSNLLKAHLYSENNIALNGSVSVYGAVTAKTLKLFSNSRIIGQSECINPTDDIQLVISPTSAKGLACDGISINFSLRDSSGSVVNGAGQELFVSSSPVSGNTDACWSNDGNITTPECNHSSDSEFRVNFPTGSPAIITRYIHSKFLNSYNIQAMVNSESLTEVAGPYEFIAQSISIVPSEGVDNSENNQIAARPFPFRLKIRGKENGNGNQLNCKIIKEDIDLTVNFSHSKQPVSSSKNLEISHNSAPWEVANNNLVISFEDGVAGGDETAADGTLLAKFDDAGIIGLTVNSTIQGKLFTTTEQFYFRPFTATICDQSGPLPSYTNDSNGAYLASGSDFDGYLKAVNWIPDLDSGNNGYGDGIPDNNNASLVCSQSVTPSYIGHNGYVAKLTPTSSVIYPVGGQVNTLTADGNAISDFKKEVTSGNQNTATVFNWNDVGALTFDVFQNDYFNRAGFNIPSTRAKVGRFYPAYFTITDTLWDYPVNQGSSEGTYAYMAQPFDDMNFEVTAYSDNDSTVTNYGLFDARLKANFLLTGDYNGRLNIAPSDLDNTHWSDATWETPDLSNSVIWSRKNASMLAGNVTTTADGPFNNGVHSITTALSLAISGVDPVSFDKAKEVLEQELLSQPDVRYGRMVLDSVGTTINKEVNIPLRVEYWNGNQFVVSDTDNKASFDGDKYCKQIIWPNPTDLSPSKLVGSGDVDKGINQTDLNADPDGNALREQVRFWLRLATESPQKGELNVNCQEVLGSNDEQPWLQYNWRGQGDEDPSTVVTFGVYRGNDRIIFRGESNIIGTSN